jgi:hypothetical protein
VAILNRSTGTNGTAMVIDSADCNSPSAYIFNVKSRGSTGTTSGATSDEPDGHARRAA